MRKFAHDMSGKTVLITGATQGLGLRVAEQLVDLDATVLVHGRNPEALHRVRGDLEARRAGARVRQYLADLSDLDQVIALAERIITEEANLDVLVNNAVAGGGVDRSRRELGAQGIELRLTVNHVAPLLLATRLKPLLIRTAPSRVVNVASVGQAEIDFDNVELDHDYDGVRAYCQSKTALIMTGFELADEWSGTGVTVNSVHPAELMDTYGVRHTGMTPATTVDEGMRPTVRAITDPALRTVTGRYFHQFTDTTAHPQTYSPEARKRLAALTRDWIARAGRS